MDRSWNMPSLPDDLNRETQSHEFLSSSFLKNAEKIYIERETETERARERERERERERMRERESERERQRENETEDNHWGVFLWNG